MEMRELPSVDALATEAIKAAGESALPNAVVLQIARSVIDEARAALLEGDEPDDLVWTAAQRIAAVQSAVPTPVVNATGVLLNPNLGRAPMPAQPAKVRPAQKTNTEARAMATFQRGDVAGTISSLRALCRSPSRRPLHAHNRNHCHGIQAYGRAQSRRSAHCQLPVQLRIAAEGPDHA